VYKRTDSKATESNVKSEHSEADHSSELCQRCQTISGIGKRRDQTTSAGSVDVDEQPVSEEDVVTGKYNNPEPSTNE